MGWLHTQGQTKKELIASRIRRQENEHGVWEYIAHCIRGNVLWTVCRVTKKATGKVDTFIGCDLLRSDPGYGWGYKDMEESMGPFYYNCPLKYLDMAPEANAKWREGVRAYHAKRQAVTEHLRNLKLGDVVNLKPGCTPPSLILASKKPLRGTYFGRTYRIARKLVAV